MEPFLGEIKLFGFAYAPTGYAQCNGQILAIAQASSLFAILGTSYGGNGTTNFALPNLQGSTAVGAGQGPGLSQWSQGEVRGSETVALDSGTMPVHLHGLNASKDTATLDAPAGNQLGRVLKGTFQSATLGLIYSAQAPGTPLAAETMGRAGGGQPHENRMPFLAVNYCISTRGYFPARN